MPASGANVENPSENTRKTGIKLKLSIFLVNVLGSMGLVRLREKTGGKN